MASKQDNYLRMHHPSIWKGMKKGGKVEDYAKGGKVKYYAQGGYNTDTVPAMLTPGEVVLNQDQQESLGNMMAGGGKVDAGQAKADALFKHIGVPGFQKGVVLPKKDDRFANMDDRFANMFADKTGMFADTTESAFPKMITDADFDKYKTPSTKKDQAWVQSKRGELKDKVNAPGFQGGGLVDKKDALMAYYGGGKVCKTKKKQKRGY
jgi:hypothetical protein